MGLLILIIILIVLAIIGYSLSSDDEDVFAVLGGGSSVLAAFALLFYISSTFFLYVNQVNDITELNVIEDRREVYQERSYRISQRLHVVLKEYSSHEENIFSDLTSIDVDIYAAKYPEIKSHELFMKYGNDLKEMEDAIYHIDIQKIDIERNIERRRQYPHIANWFLPKRY